MSEPDRRARFSQKLVDATSGVMDVAAAYVGIRAGLYRSLANDGPATSSELAARTATNERMVREWLEQQAATEVLDAERQDDGAWRFTLPAEHAAVLLDPVALDGMAGTVLSIVAEVGMAPRLVEAVRTGKGIPYADYGVDESDGQAMSSRPLYEAELASWLAAVPGLEERLAGKGARVLDIGCGQGWSSICIGRAWPEAEVDGVDLDVASIEAARAIAKQEGVDDRVRFEAKDAAELAGAGYTVATMFEMLHDLAHPVRALTAAREALGPGGVVLVADERTAETFELPVSAQDRRHYGWSLMHCLPASMTEPDSAATGTVIRPDTVRAYAEQAGFSRTEILPVDSEALRLYLLVP